MGAPNQRFSCSDTHHPAAGSRKKSTLALRTRKIGKVRRRD